MNIYIDESIHDNLGFMLLGYVICRKDPQEELGLILNKYAAKEFHSLENMDGNRKMQMLRSEFKEYINRNCIWGLFIFPSKERWKLEKELTVFLKKLLKVHPSSESNCIHLDEGIVTPQELEIMSSSIGGTNITLCKSHEVNGIQLADLIASLNGVRLREEISKKPKMLTYGIEVGFSPPIEAELGYELWATLRFSMNRGSEPVGKDMPELYEFYTKGRGLFISDKCSPELRFFAENIFGKVYIGCIH